MALEVLGRCKSCKMPTGDARRHLCESCAQRREREEPHKTEGLTICRFCGLSTGDLSAHFCQECANREGMCVGCGSDDTSDRDVGAPICDECYFSP